MPVLHLPVLSFSNLREIRVTDRHTDTRTDYHTSLAHAHQGVCEKYCTRTHQPIDPLHVTSRFGHFHIRPFGRRHVGGQKCMAVIERKALIVSLFTNASDYSNKTCMERSMCWHLTNVVVPLEWSLALVSNNTFSAFHSITAIHTHTPPTGQRPNGSVQT